MVKMLHSLLIMIFVSLLQTPNVECFHATDQQTTFCNCEPTAFCIICGESRSIGFMSSCEKVKRVIPRGRQIMSTKTTIT